MRVILSTEKIDKVDTFSCVVKMADSAKMQSRIAKAWCLFPVEKS